jgi:hypothetical protein
MNSLHLILRVCHGLCSRTRNVWLRTLGVNIQGYVWMCTIEISTQWDSITLEAGVALDRGVTLLCGGPQT